MALNAKSDRPVFWVHDQNGSPLALVLRANFQVAGLDFLTPDESNLQLGVMSRPKSEYIHAHVHEHLERQITGTQEVLYLQTGKVRIDLFTRDHEYVSSIELNPGDFVLLSEGGHGIEVLEESRLVEIKQGPFAEGKDKTRFIHELPNELEIVS